MSAKKIITALLIIFAVNLIAVVSFEIDKHNKDKVNDKVDNTEQVIVDEKQEKEQKEEIDQIDQQDSFVDDKENGKISSGGLSIDKVKADSAPSKAKWKATNYVYGDITANTWTVKKGDTLWEIAEARYGSGRNWTRIRDLNAWKIKKAPNGQRTLIMPGQVLRLK